MSEQARQVFDLEEQQVKDVLAAIKTILPVISLIREWGKVEKEFNSFENEEKRLSKEIATLGKTLGILSGTAIIDDLAEERNKRVRQWEEIQKKCQELQQKCEEYEREVILYQEYASLFGRKYAYAISKALEQNSLEEKDEVLAILFLLHNKEEGMGFQERFQVERCFEKYLTSNLLSDWNSMLNDLKANKA